MKVQTGIYAIDLNCRKCLEITFATRADLINNSGEEMLSVDFITSWRDIFAKKF
jgi:hypothetical protein